MEFEQLQRAIEAILFAAGERMEISRLSEVLEVDPDEIEKARLPRGGFTRWIRIGSAMISAAVIRGFRLEVES